MKIEHFDTIHLDDDLEIIIKDFKEVALARDMDSMFGKEHITLTLKEMQQVWMVLNGYFLTNKILKKKGVQRHEL